MRDATLRDARKHHWVPGFSGIAAIMSRPGLDKWKEGQLLESAFHEVWGSEMPYIEWAANVKQKANERSLKARDRGSEIHDAIEQYIKTGGYMGEYLKYVSAVCTAVDSELGLAVGSLEAETTFSSSLGYGGAIDGLRRSEPLLLDWKTKDKEWTDKTKLAYDDHGMQLAAYRHGMNLPNAVCANVFISPSAKIRIHIWEEDELQRLFEKFKTCLTLWQLDRKYDSSF